MTKTPPGTYARALIGCWQLIRREDRFESGELHVDPGLGPDPAGLLVYHASGTFSAQFMRRDRTATDEATTTNTASGHNNTRSMGGYDAYFGRYTVDEEARVVTQVLEGALAPENVGITVTRPMEVEGDTLTLRLATTTDTGRAIVRTLQWRRCPEPAPARDLAIPTLPSRSLPATLAFYARLGFLGRLLGVGDSYGVLTRGDLELHFFAHPELRPTASHAGCYLRVSDVSALYDDFRSAQLPRSGLPRMDVLTDKPWGMREFAIVDEDGNLLRIGQPI